MRWFKDNWIYFFLVTILAAWACILWLMKQSGHLSEWGNKPFSQATIGDISGVIFTAAILNGIFRSK